MLARRGRNTDTLTLFAVFLKKLQYFFELFSKTPFSSAFFYCIIYMD